MPVEFRYAQVEINNKPVLVDKAAIAEASQALRDGLAKIIALTDEIKESGFALETPDGMQPVVLGSAFDFSKWLSAKLGATFDLKTEVDKLPEPLSKGLSVVAGTDLVLYSAALFYIPEAKRKDNDKIKAMYGEIVFGFRVNMSNPDFPLGLNEIVIAVNNFSPA
jgi:hypothetical protein